MIRRTIIIANLLAPLIALALWGYGNFWLGLALLFVAHLSALVATLIPGCAWWGPLLSRVAPSGKSIWLTIDDGPDPDDTPAILEILRAHGAKATFFLIGERAERWPDLVRAIEADGHGIGNHTMTHPKFSFWCLGATRVRAEIAGAQDVLAGITGTRPQLFRAPAGMRNLFVHPILRELDLRLTAWSVRGRDGVSLDRDAIVARLDRGIEAGAIVLMHEAMRDDDGRSIIVDTLPRVLDSISSRGLNACLPALEER